ncbi:MAG TPA: MlaD family protein [Stellaceae bacterium]|nr:MlaD family protein [Stellaceae bacterium]
METRANYVAVGAFVLVLLVGAAGVLLWLIGSQFNTIVAYYEISFTGSVAGLGKDSTVRYNGVQVGKVAEIDIDQVNPNHVRVLVALDPTTIIRQDAVATLAMQGLTGGSYIEISGGTSGAPPFPHRARPPYPFIHSESSGLQSIFDKAPEVLKKLLGIEDQLHDMLDGKNRAAIDETLENVRKLTATLAARSPEIDAILVNTADATHQLDETAKSLNGLMEKAGGTLDRANVAVGHVDKLVGHADTLVGNVDGTVTDIRPGLRNLTQHGEKQLEQLLSNTNDLIIKVSRVVDELGRNPGKFLFGDHNQGYQPK